MFDVNAYVAEQLAKYDRCIKDESMVKDAKFPLYPGSVWRIIRIYPQVHLGLEHHAACTFTPSKWLAGYSKKGKRLSRSNVDAPEQIDVDLAKEIFETFNKLLPPF